jgi:hypothetical protein
MYVHVCWIRLVVELCTPLCPFIGGSTDPRTQMCVWMILYHYHDYHDGMVHGAWLRERTCPDLYRPPYIHGNARFTLLLTGLPNANAMEIASDRSAETLGFRWSVCVCDGVEWCVRCYRPIFMTSSSENCHPTCLGMKDESTHCQISSPSIPDRYRLCWAVWSMRCTEMTF